MRPLRLPTMRLSAAVALMCVLPLAGCATTVTTEQSSPETSLEAEDRQASWLVNNVKMCVQNLTSKTQPYEFNADFSKGENGYNTGTLGVGAFTCATSYSRGIEAEQVLFFFGDNPKSMTTVEITNTPEAFEMEASENFNSTGGFGANAAWSDWKYLDGRAIKPGATVTVRSTAATITISTNGVLTQLGENKGYVFDVRLFDPS